MKKILCLFLLFLCAILIIGSLTACSDKDDAYDLYTKMLAVMADVESIDMEITALSETSIDNDKSSGSATGNIKKAVNSETGGNDYAIKFDFGLGDGAISTTTSYFTNGVYYTETAGLKQSYNMSDKDAPFLPHADLLEFPGSAVKEFTVSKHNGGKKVEMTLDGNSVTSITEKNQSAEDYILSDVVCEFIIDKNNMLLFHRIISEERIEHMIINKDVSITVNSYNDVKIELPSDLDEYMYMDH